MDSKKLVFVPCLLVLSACNTMNAQDNKEALYPIGGAALGGLIGSQAASDGNRTKGAAIGAVVGAFAGHGVAQYQKAGSYSGNASGCTDAEINQLLSRSLGGEFDVCHWLPNSKDPARSTEAIGIVYTPIQGAAGNHDIEIGLFRRSGHAFRFAGKVKNLYGLEPRNARFFSDRIELTSTMPKPGDPRCCPTGKAHWSIDRKSLVATRLR